MITVALVSLATAFFMMVCIAVGGCAWIWRRHFGRRRIHERLSRGAFGPSRCCGRSVRRIGGADLGERRISRPTESRLEALQRRFVSGQITLDEYERDIDRLQLLSPR